MAAKQAAVTTEFGESRPAYWPIGHYGAIGDCRTAALVAPDGSIDWCCLPHFDSPALLCRLLDAQKGGYFQVQPAEPYASSMSYMTGTNVLETLFNSSGGRLRLVDFMPIRHRSTRATGVLDALTRMLPGPPASVNDQIERDIGNDVSAAHRINRLITCLEGEVTVAIDLKTSFNFARQPAQFTTLPTSTDAVSLMISGGDQYLVVQARFLPSNTQAAYAAAINLDTEADTLHLRVPLQSGQRMVVAMNYARDEEEARRIHDDLSVHDFDSDLDETLHYWREWLAECTYNGPYQDVVLRSALTLKMCIFEPSGAIVAAPTTSLPEAMGGVRNWDYRFTWLRDSVFTLDALGNLGYHDEARDYFHFLHGLHITHGDNLRIMYSIRGETDHALHEEELAHLEGYMQSAPVRVGNGAATQRQMDVYGEVIDAAYRYLLASGFRKGKRLPEPNRDVRQLARTLANYVADHWQELDSGIWEIRGDERAYVYSRAMCWVALDRACKMASRNGHHSEVARWSAAREALREDILSSGFKDEVPAFSQAYTNLALDSSNLRLPLVGFLPVHDHRMRQTVQTTGEQLAGTSGILYRYRPPQAQGQDAPPQSQQDVDGLPGSEGAFLACTFWLIMGECLAGDLDRARARFEQVLSFASPLGLFAEELDQRTGTMLGNFPQAFTHIGLVNAAVTLQRAQEGHLAPEMTFHEL